MIPSTLVTFVPVDTGVTPYNHVLAKNSPNIARYPIANFTTTMVTFFTCISPLATNIHSTTLENPNPNHNHFFLENVPL